MSAPPPPPPPRTGQDELRLATDKLASAVAEFETHPVPDGSDADKAQRSAVVGAANAVLAAAKNPTDQWMDVTAQNALMAANRLFWEWGVFDAIPLDGAPVSYDELAGKVDVQAKLLTRIGGVIVSMGVLKQVGDNQVAHTPRSLIFTKDNPVGLVYQMAWENGFVVYAQLPNYFAAYGRKEPETLTHVPGTFAYGHPEQSYYEMLEHDPVRMRRFMRAMAPIEERMPIAGIYDFSWAVAAAPKADSDSERPLFVDVGGGRGHAIKAIRAEYPGLPIERFVLQDRPEVIEAGEKLDDPDLRGVQRMVVDFHESQPLQGALIYWIRRCLHNYGDAVSTNMLRKIADAMAPDSRLLLQEDVMENPPNHMAAMLDFMMLGFGGKQRTLQTWEEVVGNAGLRISSISRGEGPWRSLAVIECVKTGE
ncbi:O-methyltransferase [Coniochaeta ligniaria NRRL 30616]|uniref:O-methyltransferase n=1 Tax=Coniochaeta ligniaria NRRL 30616 TaxID=1408157 RepID=A0A1J7J1L9_9PEZI|nr:O-methyltransferase [Coniochaeta ligniaria NRRL 30616]